MLLVQLQELPGAGFFGRGAGLHGVKKEAERFFLQVFVAQGQLGEGRQRVDAHDDALVPQPRLDDGASPRLFGWAETKPGEHLCHVPTYFLLAALGQGTEQGFLVRDQPLRTVKLPRFGGQYRTRLQGVDWIFGLS